MNFLLPSMLLFASLVVLSRNVVHSIFYLMLIYILASMVYIILGAEFLGILLVLVYVGAVCMLFLFVVMMLEIRTDQHAATFYNYLPLGILIIILTLLCFAQELTGPAAVFQAETLRYPGALDIAVPRTNAYHIGSVMYNILWYYPNFIAVALLVCMMGCIMLAHIKTEKKTFRIS